MGDRPIYHERQRLLMCAQHCLNNLLQAPVFDKASLDSICASLDPPRGWKLNQHKNPLGLGNYDINVMMVALSQVGLETKWLPDHHELIREELVTYTKFILHSGGHWLNFGSGHWVAIVKVDYNGVWFNLDSKLDEPRVIGSDDDMVLWIKRERERQRRLHVIALEAKQ